MSDRLHLLWKSDHRSGTWSVTSRERRVGDVQDAEKQYVEMRFFANSARLYGLNLPSAASVEKTSRHICGKGLYRSATGAWVSGLRVCGSEILLRSGIG